MTDAERNVFIRGRWIVFRAAEGRVGGPGPGEGEWMSHLFLPLPPRPRSMGTVGGCEGYSNRLFRGEPHLSIK